MLFQKKVDEAFRRLHDDSDAAKAEQSESEMTSFEDYREKNRQNVELEKGDGLALFLSAMIVILPVALIVLGVLALVGYLFIT